MTPPPVPHEEDSLGRSYDPRIAQRLLRYLRPYRWRVAGTVALLVAGALLQTVGPLLIQRAIDEAIPAGDLRLLGILATGYLGAALLIFALQYAQTLATTWLGQRVMYDLRGEIFVKLQKLEIRFFDRNPVGRLMTRITSDVETLNELFSSGVVAIFGDLFTLLFIAGAMALIDWRLALVTLSVIPLVVWCANFFRNRIRHAFRDIRTRTARINTFLHERITGMRVVQLFNREEADIRSMDALNRDYLEAQLRSVRYYALFFPIVEVFMALSLALIIAYGGGSVLSGEITVGVITSFLLYARRFFRPIQDLSEKYNLLQSAIASSERVFDLLDRGEEVSDPVHPTPLPVQVRGEIEFQDVWFAYDAPDGDGNGPPEWILRGVSFRIAPGERVALVGHTGAGKTTIVHLLMRFYDPQQGRILLDGIPIQTFAQEEMRKRIGLVLQDTFLFSEDIRYNIRLGSEEIPDDRVEWAAHAVGVEEIAARTAGGYDRQLGERGGSLSTGERQLISFARVIAMDPKILVLDEATSSVDSEFEARIEGATKVLLEGRTAMIVAHRLSTIRDADRILVLHKGELAEEGTHEELLKRRGLYARLYELQFSDRR